MQLLEDVETCSLQAQQRVAYAFVRLVRRHVLLNDRHILLSCHVLCCSGAPGHTDQARVSTAVAAIARDPPISSGHDLAMAEEIETAGTRKR